MAPIDETDAYQFEDTITGGMLAIFPADTVYGLAVDPHDEKAVKRLYAVKGRPQDKPAALMFFSLDSLLGAFPDLGVKTRAAVEKLLPGAVTLLLPNPRGLFPLTGGTETVGVRLPRLQGDIQALEVVTDPVLQTSANTAGGPDAATLDEIPQEIRDQADMILDAGALPGTPSTVVSLARYEDDGTFEILREGAVPRVEIDAALA